MEEKCDVIVVVMVVVVVVVAGGEGNKHKVPSVKNRYVAIILLCF